MGLVPFFVSLLIVCHDFIKVQEPLATDRVLLKIDALFFKVDFSVLLFFL